MLFTSSDEKRLSLIGAAVLIVLTLTAGLSVYAVMRQQAQALLSRNLEVSLVARVRTIEIALREHMEKTAALSSQATLRNALSHLDPHSAQFQVTAQRFLNNAMSQDFGTLILLDKKGGEVARAGAQLGSPQFSVALDLPYRSRLEWDGGFLISTQANIFRDGQHLGTLIAIARLPELVSVLMDTKALGELANLTLCSAEDKFNARCFPSRLSPASSQHLPRQTASGSDTVISLALAGKAGFARYPNGENDETVAAYMPVGTLGLAAVLSTDAATLYQPIDKQVVYILPILGLLIVLGGFLLRWQVLPLIRKVLASEQQTRDLNQKLRRNEARIRAVLDRVDEGIISITSLGVIRTFNPAAERIFGYSAEEVVGNDVSMLMPQPYASQCAAYLGQYLESGKGLTMGIAHEALAKRRDGQTFPVEINVAEVKIEGEHLFIGALRDIAERKASEARVMHLANHDNLTNLPNRNLLQDRARQALSAAARQELRVGVLFIDLDQFKTINDSLGHHIGDRLLQTVASRILACMREEDTVARQGGDEFIVVLPNIKRFEDVAMVAQKLLLTLAAPYAIDKTDLHTSASIGVAVYPEDGSDIETLMRNADTAMYHAKTTGRNNFQFFTPKMNQAAGERLSLENKLRHALERQEFALAYQPIVSVADNRVRAAEALLRWTPESGPITPDRFIPIAEETGLIVPIGEWVLRAALQERRRWLDEGYLLPRMFVNMSARQFAQKNLVAMIGRMLQEVGLPPEHLGIEITESLLMEHPEDAVRSLKTISAMGVQIAIDDFGTGYSSLSYLKRFPLHKIKIDRSFVRDIATDPDDAAIVTAIIAMAHSLNATVVAEGVETEDQLSFLRAHGCDEFQGYLFSRPVPGAEACQHFEKTCAVSAS